MQSYSNIIISLGDYEQLADFIGERPGTVAVWKHRDSIPPRVWRKIAALPSAKECGVTLEALANIAEQRGAA